MKTIQANPKPNARMFRVLILTLVVQAASLCFWPHLMVVLKFQGFYMLWMVQVAGYALAYYLSGTLAKLPAVWRVLVVVSGAIATWCVFQFILGMAWLFGFRLIYGVYPMWGHE